MRPADHSSGDTRSSSSKATPVSSTQRDEIEDALDRNGREDGAGGGALLARDQRRAQDFAGMGHHEIGGGADVDRLVQCARNRVGRTGRRMIDQRQLLTAMNAAAGGERGDGPPERARSAGPARRPRSPPRRKASQRKRQPDADAGDESI